MIGMKNFLVLLSRVLYIVVLFLGVIAFLTFIVLLLYAWVQVFTGKIHFQ
jgi:hypothetical protein